MYIPLAVLGSTEIAFLRNTLLHKSKYEDENLEEDEEPLPPIKLYDESQEGVIGIPRAFGLHRYPNLATMNLTTHGEPFIDRILKRPSPHHTRVRNPLAQAKFMQDLITAARVHGTFLATAPTGSGKTVCALNMAAELGRKTLILVHLERLMAQWIDEIKDKLGVPEHRIGILQGDTCQFHDRDFVIGMLHSLNLNAYPSEFFSSFGTVIFDETHKLGTRFFAPSCPMFPAAVKVGLSATMTRKDKGEKVFIWHLGPVRVRSQAEALPMKVYRLQYNNPRHPKYGIKVGAVSSCLSKDKVRNGVITKVIKRFYDAERQALIVGFSVGHLQELMRLSHEKGVPKEAMGQFTGMIHHYYEENGIKKMVKRKQSGAALSLVKKNARLVFATYGMITEGIDEPRWDAGMDVTPRGSATQLIGRIRRPVPGKKEPIWVTIHDTDHHIADGYYYNRCKDYLSSGAEIIETRVKT